MLNNPIINKYCSFHRQSLFSKSLISPRQHHPQRLITFYYSTRQTYWRWLLLLLSCCCSLQNNSIIEATISIIERVIILLKSSYLRNIWLSRKINNLLLCLIKILIFLFNRSYLLFQSRNNNRRSIAGYYNYCIHQSRLSYRCD